MSVSNIAYNSTTKLVTFDFTVTEAGEAVGWQVSDTSGGFEYPFSYLPEYSADASYGYQQVTPAQVRAGVPIFTTEAVAFYSQAGWINWEEWQNTWSNTQVTGWTNGRNTASNTITNKKFINGPGYPEEWAVAFCVACNIGGHFHVVVDDDGTFASGLANYLYAQMPVGVPIFIELGNELWNPTGAAADQFVINLSATYNESSPGFLDYDGSAVTGIASTTCSGGQGTISGSVFTCTSAPTSGTYQVGMTLEGSGLTTGDVYISSLGTGTGGTGTYDLNTSATVSTAEIINGGMTVVTYNSTSQFNVNNQITMEGLVGPTQINGLAFSVAAKGGTSGAYTATIPVDSSGYSSWTSGGVISNAVTGMNRYVGYRQYLNAAAFSSAFGSRFGTDVTIVMPWQKSGYPAVNNALAFLVEKYGNAYDYVHMTGFAPYIWRDNRDVPAASGSEWAGVDYITNGTDYDVSDMEGQLTANATYQTFISSSEHYLAMSLHYGLKGRNGVPGLFTYENGWEVGTEVSTSTNVGATIIDSGMQAIVQLQLQKNWDSGVTNMTWEKGGCLNASNYQGCAYELDPLYSDLILSTPTTSPRWLALKAFMEAGYTPQRNVIAATGVTTIPGTNFLDSDDTVETSGPNFGSNNWANPPWALTGPYGNTHTCYVPTGGTYSIAGVFTTTASGTGTLEVDGVTVASGVSIPSGLTNQAVTFGSVALSAGFHEITYLTAAYSNNITLEGSQFTAA
jgi:hypothetical protein